MDRAGARLLPSGVAVIAQGGERIHAPPRRRIQRADRRIGGSERDLVPGPGPPGCFTIDTLPPAAPSIIAPADGSVTSQLRPPFSGTAEPGATVSVRIDGAVAGTATADSNGSWTFTPSSDLADGPHPFSATAADAAGNTSGPSPAGVVTVDTTPVPTISAPAPSALLSTSRP